MTLNKHPLSNAWAKGAPKFTNSTSNMQETKPQTQVNNFVEPTKPIETIENSIKKTLVSDVPRFNWIGNKFEEIAEYFYVNGFVIIDNAISSEQVGKLKAELAKVQTTWPGKSGKKYADKHEMYKCFFENSPTTVDIIESSKLADFAQYVIADVPDNRVGNTSLKAHVIHSNAFSVPPGGRGQAPVWHVDDPPQQVIVPPGKTLPDWLKLPVLVCTYMIWLSDCDTPEHGPTHVVPGSHRFGRVVDPELAEQLGIPACGKAGTAVLVNANVWHRGCGNKSDRARDTLQITWARRIIGHKHKTIMNYQMPPHVYESRSEQLKERMGFLQGGAYS